MRTLLRILWKLIKVGLFTVGCIAVLGVLLAIIGAAALSASATHKIIADKSVLVFNLDTEIRDRPTDEMSEAMAKLFGKDESILQLSSATTALRQAAQDKRISGLYLHGNLRASGYSSGYGALKELREAIHEFQKSGKPVIAYMNNAENRDFYVDSVADQVLLSPLGIIAFTGMATEGMFFKGTGDKYGFQFTATRHGKYKGAIEPFTRKEYSPENREQLQALLNAIWGDVRNTVAGTRKITPDELQALVDNEGLISARTAKDHGLVTELAYEGEAINKLRKLTGHGTNDANFPQISIAEYAREAEPLTSGHDKVAVVYAEGEIVDGNSEEVGRVAGDRFAKIIRDIREEKDVKALVLRVNSPGGSGQASEVMLDELRRFNSERPVVVSMGTVAASGGYYISMASRRIFAEPSTITGSIGVFGLTFNAQQIANDHGLTFDTVKTGELADMGTISRPMTPKEQTVLQNIVDDFYGRFLERVATDRKMTTNHVDDIAQGRVWSGTDALGVGLVDEMGGLHEAIAAAAKDASLGTDYSVVEYPEPKRLVDQISDALRGDEQPLAKASFAGKVMDRLKMEMHWLAGFNDPHGIYARLPCDLKLN